METEFYSPDNELRTAQRVHFLDLMRGFAVIVMVMGHSIDSVLSDASRTTDWFRIYDTIRGFTAPMFLFVSGFAFIVSTEKNWDSFRSFTKPLRKRLNRYLFLLFIGYALHFPIFSLYDLIFKTNTEGYQQFFQVDILHCLVTSLLILHGLIWFAPDPRVWVVRTLAITSLIVLSSPLVWSVDFSTLLSPVIAPYLNQKQISIFPIFPYGGFVLSGAVVGHFFLEARQRTAEKPFFLHLFGLGLFAGFLGLLLDWIPFSVYPPHDFWKVSPDFYLIRFGIVTMITALISFIQRIPTIAARQLVLLGQASLLIYVSHLLIVYGSARNFGLAQKVGRILPYSQAVLVAFGVLGSMILFIHLWNYLKQHHRAKVTYIKLAVAAILLFQFFTWHS